MYPLQTTHSPESPTAWASFATGVNAGKHNIYDFLVRDTATYLPDLGMVTRTPPKFLFNYFPISKPKLTSIRGGTSFWVTAGKQGVRSDMLTVPVTFPPEDVANGFMLSGLPLPDIRGTMGTFSYYATDLEPLRRRQHRDGRHPQAAGLRGGHGVERARRSAEPDRPAADRSDPPQGADAERERPRAARRAAGGPGRARPVHDPVEPRREDRVDRDRRPDDRARTRQVDAVDRSDVQGQLHRPAARHGADAAGERRQRAAALRVAGELQAGPAADPDLVAGRLLGRSLQGDRQLPHARLGGSDLGAERGAHGREDVHGRPDGGVRRPRQGDPQPGRREGLGSADRRDRVHRPRPAHDVAPDRSEASALRRRAGVRSSATRSSASTSAPTTSSARSSSASAPTCPS